MGYFRELPNIEYLSPLSDRNSASEYIEAKNLFKRFKLRDDLLYSVNNFQRYEINGEDRPDQVADKIYGSPQLDWVVLISANIINVRDQWPLSHKDVYEYASDVYGNSLNEVRFHETIEIKDSRGRTVLPAGKIVDYNFKSPIPNDTSLEVNTSYVKFYDSGLESQMTKYNITVPVTNMEYEIRRNDAKRSIEVLKSSFLQTLLSDVRNSAIYTSSSQKINRKLKRAHNLRLQSP